MTNVILIFCAILAVILLTAKFKLHAFFALILTALVLALAALPQTDVIPALKTGFGNTLASIGLIIVFGTTIGVILDRTGGTTALALAIVRLTGGGKAPRAIAMTGFLTGLPIFCDSGFMVLSGLNKSLARASGATMTRMAATLAVALYVPHCLIPPHPGITAAAGVMGGSIGKLVLLGIAIALPASVAAYLWVKIMSPPAGTATSDTGETPAPFAMENLPSAGKALLPVVMPLALITANSLIGLMPGHVSPLVSVPLLFLGDPVTALLIGVLLALLLVPSGKPGAINAMCGDAIEKAGPILAITAAGGAFGAVIKAVMPADFLSSLLAGSHLGLAVPFLLAAILKTAQGSSTVAAITTGNLVAPMLAGLGFAGEWGATLALLAVGAGSMMVSHANDSYFWVVTKFSDIDSSDTLRVFSTASAVAAVTVLLLTWAVSFVLL